MIKITQQEALYAKEKTIVDCSLSILPEPQDAGGRDRWRTYCAHQLPGQDVILSIHTAK